jgi:sugar phosphate isomerase/epimerase
MSFMMNKICVAATIEESYPGALVLFRGIKNSIKSAKKLGYDGIELALYEKENIDLKETEEMLRDYEMSVPVISTGQIYTIRGLSFASQDKENRKNAVEAVKELIDIAAELNADLNISRVRGTHTGNGSPAEGMMRISECLYEICRYAKRLGISILLEQMNRYETTYLNSVREVAEYIRELGIENLKIHADLFHMNIEDAEIPETLRVYGPQIGYIHFADSNRLPPGQGHINFGSVLEAMRDIGYEGWIGIEVLVRSGFYEAAKQSIEYLRKYSSLHELENKN